MPCASGMEMVDAQAAHDSDQKRLSTSDLLIGLLPANERVLENVLGVGHAAHHAVGDGEEKAAILAERGQPVRVFYAGGRCLSGRREMIMVPHRLPSPVPRAWAPGHD